MPTAKMPNNLLLGALVGIFVWRIKAKSTTVHPWFVYVLKILFLIQNTVGIAKHLAFSI